MYKIKKLRFIINEYKIRIISFIIFLIALIFVFYNIKENRIEKYIHEQNEEYQVQYESIYENFKQLSQHTFYGIINKPEIYDNVKIALHADEKTKIYYRKKLFDQFLSDYTRLQSYDFKQVHFHFPDNTSFLRMHKPSKYGDSLTSARFSVVQTNKILKPVDGFEIGKIIHGFRFVYPLHDKNLLHIGSVEVSVAGKFFEKQYERNSKIDAHFLINKKIAKEKMFKDAYKQQVLSIENSDYFISPEDANETSHYLNNHFFTKNDLRDIKIKMSNEEKFVLIKRDNVSYLTIGFLPIKNTEGTKISAYIVLYKHSDYINQIYYNFYIGIFILVLLAILFIIYIDQKYKFDKKQKKKEELLTQQSKMASMGEMIGNIAHQWRQPLSVISTAASGMQLQKEMNILTDDVFLYSTDEILKSTKYLSQTIEDFRNFFKTNKEKRSFIVNDIIEQSLSIFGSSFATKDITIVKNIDKDISLVSYPNELQQVLINLFKNAKDAIDAKGIILISVQQQGNEVYIKVQDSGGGISNDVLPRIFEPYFTTKHQSIGTGLGLFMSHEIIHKNMRGILDASNEEFTYNFKNYKGAAFTIILKKKN